MEANHNSHSIENSIDNILKKIVHTELFLESNLKRLDHDSFIELYLPAQRQFIFSELMKSFPDLYTLYKEESEDGLNERWISFSFPSPNNMYALCLESDIFGVGEGVIILVFESLEYFYKYLYRELQKTEGVMMRKEEMSLKELIDIFF